MSLIVEDGSIVDGAESYASVDDANTYLDAMGMTTWANLTDTDKERALRRATMFMLARYRGRWKGSKVKYAQSLDWPRVGVTPADAEPPYSTQAGFGYGYQYEIPYTSVPKEVKNACCELAFRAAAGPLMEDLQQQILQETVGPITTKYDNTSPQSARYVFVDAILGPLLVSSGNSAMAKLQRT
jgi:hypothetical protein